jgi:hypothetical protein
MIGQAPSSRGGCHANEIDVFEVPVTVGTFCPDGSVHAVNVAPSDFEPAPLKLNATTENL